MTIQWGKGSGANVNLTFSGNVALNGTRILNAGELDDDIALAFGVFIPDEHTAGLWHLDGNGLDAGPNGNDLTNNGVIWETTDPWVGTGEGIFDGSSYLYCADTDSLSITGAMTLEAWAATGALSTGLYIIVSKYWSAAFSYYLGIYQNRVRALVNPLGESTHDNCFRDSDIVLDNNTRYHIAMVFEPGSRLDVYINGELHNGALTGDIPSQIADTTANFEVGSRNGGEYCWLGKIDEVRLSSVARYLTEFSPHRYEDGTVTLRHSLTDSMRLTAIDWDGAFGASYGYVTQVEVYSGGQWRVVASDPAGLTPPITGLEYMVSGPDILRFTLVPKQDTLQSETPIVDWVLVNLEPLTRPARRHLQFSCEQSIIAVTSRRSEIRVTTSRKELGVK